METVGDRIRRRRLERDLSQHQLARVRALAWDRQRGSRRRTLPAWFSNITRNRSQTGRWRSPTPCSTSHA